MPNPPTTGAHIPVHAPGRQSASDAAHLMAQWGQIMAAGRFLHGPQTAAFESEFAEFLGVRHCVAVGNGTDALEFALRAVGLGPGDRIATVANAGHYGTSAIMAIGAVPVYVDISADSWQMDPLRLEQVLPNEVDAVLLTHLFGDARTAPAIARLCAGAGIPLIEDCAQAAGAVVDGVAAGTFGASAAFSFYPTKNLAAAGDAGAVVTNSGPVAARVRQLAEHGWGERFVVTSLGRNSRMDEIQAAVLRHRLPQLARHNDRRRAIRDRYREVLAGSALALVGGAVDAGHAVHLAVVTSQHVTACRERLAAAGVATDVHYPVEDHHQPLHAGDVRPMLPVTDAVAGTFFTVPCHPWLTDDEIARIAQTLREEAARAP